MCEAWLRFSAPSFAAVRLLPAEMPSRAGPGASASAQHHQSGEARAGGARPGEKSNVRQWVPELSLEIQRGFALRSLCTPISSRQHIPLLAIDGM